MDYETAIARIRAMLDNPPDQLVADMIKAAGTKARLAKIREEIDRIIETCK